LRDVKASPVVQEIEKLKEISCTISRGLNCLRFAVLRLVKSGCACRGRRRCSAELVSETNHLQDGHVVDAEALANHPVDGSDHYAEQEEFPTFNDLNVRWVVVLIRSLDQTVQAAHSEQDEQCSDSARGHDEDAMPGDGQK